MTIFEQVKECVTARQAAEHYGIKVKGNGMAAGGAGMRLFRMIVSIFVMLIAGLIGFFVGLRIDEAMGGAVLFSVIAGIACVIYTIENQEK